MRAGRWILIWLLMLTTATAQLEPQAHPSAVSENTDAPSLAPGALGTRSSTPLRTTMPSGGGYAWLQMTLALMLVAIGLRYGLPRLISWAGKTGVGSRLDGEIRLLESRAVPGGSLLMVKARDRLLLIGATPQGMQLLADLTSQLDQVSSLGLAHTGQGAQPIQQQTYASTQQGGFEQILHRTVSTDGRTTAFADLQQETASELQGYLERARARLSRMAAGGGKG